MRVRIFQPQCCVPVAVLLTGYAEVVFIQPGGKLDTMWRGAWQRLATRHQLQGEIGRYKGRCSRTALPLTLPETHKLAAWEPSVHWDKRFVHRIARIWTRLTCHLGCSLADGLPSSKFLLSWQNEESDCQKHGRNYLMAQSLPIHHFCHFFNLRLMSFARWHHYYPRLIQYLFNISKVIGRKTKWVRFLAYPVCLCLYVCQRIG